MNNKFVTILITFVFFALLIGAVVIQSNKEGLQHENSELKDSINVLEDKYKTTQEDFAVITEQNKMLQDSIQKLNATIGRLRGVIAQKNREIRTLKKKADRYESKISDLSTQISQLVRNGKSKQSTIDKLEIEKTKLQNKREAVYKNLTVVDFEKGKAEDDELSYIEEKKQHEKITDIVNNTRVTYKAISLKKGRFKREFTHLSKKGKNWNFSLFRVKLEHKHISDLLDKRFVFRIYDKDNADYVAYVESNPQFKKEDKGGYIFKFDGNIREIQYTNTQEKRGNNYETHIFLIMGDSEYLLNKSIFQIIKNGKAKLI